MTATKPPLEADIYAYEFSSLLGTNAIASITSVQQYAEFGRAGDLSQQGTQVVGTQVRVVWAGGSPGSRYGTNVTILDSGGNTLQVFGEICVGVNSCAQGSCFDDCRSSACGCQQIPCVCLNPSAIVVNVIGGQLKRFIVQRAYGVCGQGIAEFELTNEEYSAALRCLNDTMAMLEDQDGICLGYNYPTYGEGSPEDESGIPRGATQAVVQILARELAPMIGKTLGAEAVSSYTRAYDLLKASYSSPPRMRFGRGTIRGAGNRWPSWRGPFFHVRERHPHGCRCDNCCKSAC